MLLKIEDAIFMRICLNLSERFFVGFLVMHFGSYDCFFFLSAKKYIHEDIYLLLILLTYYEVDKKLFFVRNIQKLKSQQSSEWAVTICDYYDVLCGLMEF